MPIASLALLPVAAATVAVLHAVLPDHWVPLAALARMQRWSLARVARVTVLAAGGHVVASLVLAGIVAVIGLRFERLIDTQQGHLVGGVLVGSGLLFLVWGLLDRGHSHQTHHHDPAPLAGHRDQCNTEDVPADPSRRHEAAPGGTSSTLVTSTRRHSRGGRLAAIVVPFGVVASPDLTILPMALAASGYGGGAVLSVLAVFAIVTMLVFVGLTLIATLAGYQIKGEWLERHATTVTALVLIAIGVVAFVGL